MAEYRFRHLLTHVIAGAVGAGIVLGAQFLLQPATDSGTDSEDEFGTSVRDYLQDNPDVVINAIKKYQANAEQKQIQASQQFVKDNKAAFFNNPVSPVVGNPDGDVTLVEFFDYNCHYCRGVAPDVAKLITDDPKLRVVMKNLPILGPTSISAAKVALAGHMQSAAIYDAINKGLWAHEGVLTDADIEKIARTAGAKWDKILVDKESDTVMNEIKANYGLAQKMGLTGTPGFVVGTQVYPGAQNYDQLKAAVAGARRVADNATPTTPPSATAAANADATAPTTTSDAAPANNPAAPTPAAASATAPEMPTPAPTTTQVSQPPTTDKTASPAAPPAPAAK